MQKQPVAHSNPLLWRWLSDCVFHSSSMGAEEWAMLSGRETFAMESAYNSTPSCLFSSFSTPLLFSFSCCCKLRKWLIDTHGHKPLAPTDRSLQQPFDWFYISYVNLYVCVYHSLWNFHVWLPSCNQNTLVHSHLLYFCYFTHSLLVLCMRGNMDKQ